jgi:hypothetical protein
VKKPSDLVIKLYEMGRLRGISVEMVPVGADGTETYVTIEGNNKQKVRILTKTFNECLELDLSFDWVCRLRPEHKKHVEAWKEFEAKNAKELAEYQRLKEKFG